jgi:hypothetical protein
LFGPRASVLTSFHAPIDRFRIPAAILLAVPSGVRAQISVQVKMERDTLILFESIPAVVTIRNFSGRTIELANRATLLAQLSHYGRSWREPVSRGRCVRDGTGQDRTGPHAEHFREPVDAFRSSAAGRLYRASRGRSGRSACDIPARQLHHHQRSRDLAANGWPAVGEGETNQQYRTYSLLLRRNSYDEVLYAGVQDEPHNLVYGMIPLGDFIALGNPTPKRTASVICMCCIAADRAPSATMKSIPTRRIVKRVVYSDVMSEPQLVAQDDGVVTVQGGEQVYPRLERVMTDEDLQPPPSVIAKPKKHKHWWWPFGPKTAPPASHQQDHEVYE